MTTVFADDRGIVAGVACLFILVRFAFGAGGFGVAVFEAATERVIEVAS